MELGKGGRGSSLKNTRIRKLLSLFSIRSGLCDVLRKMSFSTLICFNGFEVLLSFLVLRFDWRNFQLVCE